MDHYLLSYDQSMTPPSKHGFVKDIIYSEKVLSPTSPTGVMLGVLRELLAISWREVEHVEHPFIAIVLSLQYVIVH